MRFGVRGMTADTDAISDLRILLAEDDPLMARIMGALLAQLGCAAPVTVGDGAAALEHLGSTEDQPDVFITDLNMPGMDGIELLRHIAERQYKGPLILVSGEHADVLQTTLDLARTHGLNVVAALTKPVVFAALGAALEAAAASLAASLAPDLVPGPAADEPATTRAIITADDIALALEQGQFTVFYQPKASIETRTVSGVEALVRWNHPDHGIIGPDEFIPLAEQSDMIIALTDVVLREAIAQGGRWAAADTPLTVSINLSMDCLSRLDYPDFIARLANEAGFDCALIMLEITESRLIKEMTSALEVLTRLRMKGFGLSIDDFGTGYSSMEQLQRLPFTELKIDRAFVHGAQHDAKARAILESSADLGRRLGMRIVAEGVEEDGDLACVGAMGCDVVQGFIVSRPMAAIGFNAWLADWKSGNG